VIREHALRIGDRSVLLVEGPAGWGECSPLPGYPCDPAVARAAAVDAATVPFPPRRRDRVAVNALVADGGFDPAALVGAPAVKVKVGRGDVARDVARVAAVRDAVGPHVELRIDANGAWDVETAAAAITAMTPSAVALAEQPVATIEELAALRRRVAVPLAADECVRTVEDAARVRARDAADVIVLKVQPLGGVHRALAVAAAAGLPTIVTSMLETSVGLAAGLALACALPDPPGACGLATLDAIAGDVTHTPLRPEGWVLEWRAVIPAADLLVRYSEMS
jgi:O-succinylbenzoate synthase